MNWTNIFNGIGHFFEWTFKFMKHPGNGYVINLSYWLLFGAMFMIWMRMQMKYNREAKANNQLP